MEVAEFRAVATSLASDQALLAGHSQPATYKIKTFKHHHPQLPHCWCFLCAAQMMDRKIYSELLVRWNTSTHLVSSAGSSEHTHVFKCYSLEGFWTLWAHSTVITLTSAKKGLITTVPNAGTSDCSTLPAHRMLSSCQELTGAPSVLQESPKASPASHVLPASFSPSQPKNSHRIDGALLLGVKKEQRKNRTEGPTRTGADHKASCCLGQVPSYPEQPHHSSLLPWPWQAGISLMRLSHLEQENDCAKTEKKTKTGIFRILYAPN